MLKQRVINKDAESTPTGETKRPDPEVVAKAKRRTFSAKYKLSTLAKVDAIAGDRDEIAALLRREGLYSSHLTAWRKERDRGALSGPGKKRGRLASPDPRLKRENERLTREVKRLTDRLAKAEAIIGIQKKACMLLELTGLTGSV